MPVSAHNVDRKQLKRFRLTAEQREGLMALDARAIVAMGAHPLVPFLATVHARRQRCG
jgi:hypothetical protein